VTVGTGLGFIYYSFFTAQLYVLGTAAGAFRYGWTKRRFKPIFVLAFLLTAAIGSMHLDSALYIIEHGRNGASIQRAKSDAETYALKPINFFAPGGNHRLEFMRTVSNRAAAQSVISGEFPSPYLGMEAALALCALGVFAMRLVARGRTGLVVGWASTALWLTLAHSTGGINSFLGLLDVRLFRSVNRVSVVVLAIALLFGAWWLGRLLAGKKPLVRWLAVAALGAFGVWEQLPRSDSPETIAANRRAAESDRKLVAQMENALPHGAMVFELPVMDFPEVPPFQGVDSYEMFRPTIFARSLRFSHGDVKGRPNAGWKFRVASLPLPQMLEELRSAGFSALYVNRKGFPDGGAALVRELGASGCRVIAEAELHDTLALAL
jgi:phosphoglycerol transferase